MKEFEGKEMIFRPTGNNFRIYGPEPVHVRIIKVGRVNVTFRKAGLRHEEVCRFDGRDLDNGHNGGYVAYASQEELDDYFEQESLARLITTKYRNSRDFMRADLAKLKQVAELLGVQGAVNESKN